ncbi:hypothetical protein U1Q18_008504 [Sarracenia purpurea var. burkii]
MEKGENFREKALNFGDLDWKYIGKWNYERNHTLQRGNADDSSCSSSSSYKVKELQHYSSQNHCPAEHKSIVLLSPKQSKKCSEIIQSSEPRPLVDGKLREADWESFSDAFSYEEVHSLELYSELPHSCPLPAGEEIGFEMPNTQPGSNVIWTYQEATNPTAVKGRHPSPNHRFTFSRARMGKSSSFKEGSIVQSKVSDSLDNAGQNRATTSGRARSSPLRRFLAPLLKIRVKNPHHSADTVQPMTGNLNLTSNIISRSESLQALLQIIVQNGLPFFKLVNNNNEILIATTKLPTSVKNDAHQIYKFYSVCEIKKSGSWINQKHKGKSYGFGYNFVGHMKASSPLYPVRESVLYGVDLSGANLETQELTASRELAAIVVKIPFVNSHDNNGEYMSKGKEGSREDRKNFFINAETEKFNSTTVIIPGGVHGLPNKGFPSPLIDRWRSGGSCDCGGWDVGCKLRILTNEDQNCKLPEQYVSCSNPDHFDLFDQGGGAHHNRPIFSLIPLNNGNYSVEFSATISLLQAFSVCVAAISSQNSFDIPEVNSLAEPKVIHESTTPTIIRGKVPTRYVPSPPPSPVGRV